MFSKRVAYEKKGEALWKENYRLVVQVYNISMKYRAAQVMERIERDKIYEKRAENYQLNSSISILSQISNKWSKKGKQLNRLRLIVCWTFQAQYTNSKITLGVRHFTFRSEFFVENVWSKENNYAAIHKRIQKQGEDFAAGKMNDLLDLKGIEMGVAMRSKSVKVNARGRLPLLYASYVEQELMKWIEELWWD